jgi:hypothetical protein
MLARSGAGVSSRRGLTASTVATFRASFARQESFGLADFRPLGIGILRKLDKLG